MKRCDYMYGLCEKEKRTMFETTAKRKESRITVKRNISSAVVNGVSVNMYRSMTCMLEEISRGVLDKEVKKNGRRK